jgi:hypothetical protein
MELQTDEQKLAALKVHHDEVDAFYRELTEDTERTYTGYQNTAIGADIAASIMLALVNLAADGYRISVLAVTDISKSKYAFDALMMAYRPLTLVLGRLQWKGTPTGTIMNQIDATLSRLTNVGAMVSGILAPSNWARIIANARAGHWRDIFSRQPAAEILGVIKGIKVQHAQTLEAMERQINAIEKRLGRAPTLYACHVY